MTTFDLLAETAILIAGAPRSGTTWFAKIFDSHPEVLYRHEPDDGLAPADDIRADMARWIARHDPRAAGKRPFFAKNWQAAPARILRAGLAYSGAAASRIGLPAWPIPDLGAIVRARAVVKSVRVRQELGAFARACPKGHAILILRDPRGQVASVMRGTVEGRFGLAEAGTDMPFDEASTLAFAARFGVTEPDFHALPHAAQYAWAWRDFNETAADSITGESNAQLVIYEDLCANPLPRARSILEFAGLTWHSQTETFIHASTSHDDAAGYYALTRDAIAAAGRWRTTMTPSDQAAVRAVMAGSPLARYWPDLNA